MTHQVNPRTRLGVSVLLLVMAGLAPAATLTVGPGAGYDFDTIQAGVDAAVDGDTVLVAPGEYVVTEPVTFRGKAITVKSETGRDETTIRMGTPVDTKRGTVVIFENNETAASILEGFTITGGTGSWVESVNVYAGGGISFEASSGTVGNCAIVQNDVEASGGGILCAYTCSPRLFDCIIADNSAGVSGAGVFSWSGASLAVTDCTIIDNSTGDAGGGAFCGTNSSMTMTDCTISDNYAASHGAGIMSWDNSSVTLSNCTITKNSSAREEGALFCGGNSSMTVTNCTVTENSAASECGALLCWQNSFVMLANSIFWGNTAPQGGEIRARNGGEIIISYSNVAGGQSAAFIDSGGIINWDIGNIDADPCFARLGYSDGKGTRDPSDDVWVKGDFHLKSQAGRWDPNNQVWVMDDVTSPCVDAGDPNSDWSGETWPHGGRINMGAYGGTREASMSTKTEVMSLPRVAYVHGSDAEATDSFQSLLMSYGCPTTLFGVEDVATAALDSYDVIIVASDTKYLDARVDAQSVAPIEGSGKPIIGLGQGGYDFFGVLELWIGRPNGGHGSQNSVEVIDPNCSLFSTPYSVDIPEDRVLQLYTETNHIGIYLWPTIPETVTVLASEVNDVGYFPLVMEDNRYLFWGFTQSPLKMTEVGKTLFINVVIWTANAGWEIEI